MKKTMEKFSNLALSRDEKKKVNGGGCSDDYLDCVDGCGGQSSCMLGCWSSFSRNCREY